MEIRPASAADAHEVRAVIVAAFGAEGARVADIWADVVQRGLDRAALVAVDETEIVGHVGLSHAWLDARERLVDVLVLSPLSVTPSRQRGGIGTALLGAAVDAAEGLRTPAVLLEGSRVYYGARGFARASEHGFEAPSRRTPDAAFQVALLSTHESWMTGRVVYRDVWWEHDAAGLRDPLLAELEAVYGDGA